MSTTSLAKRGVNLDRLNDRQRKFVAHYLIHLNGSKAAKAAGYRHPKVMACKLLRNPKIAAAIGKRQADDLASLQLTRERILQELAAIALRDPLDLCDDDGLICVNDLRALPERVRRSIDGIKCRQSTDADGNTTQEISLRLAPKTPAVEMVMRHLGMFAADKEHVVQTTTLNWADLYIGQDSPLDTIAQRLLEETKNG